MPTSSSSNHLSSQFQRRSKTNSRLGSEGEEKGTGRRNTWSGMKPQEEAKKAPNGLLVKKERGVRYKECRKNHAANIGGYAVDGCREFMAAGEEGTSAALKCAACSCHRNFHKKEVELDSLWDCSSNSSGHN
ncbi:hypothetical protein ACLOJK_000153 [Asimina triloba]